MKIIVFGDVPLATNCIRKIIKTKNAELLGVVCNKHPKGRFDHHFEDDTATFQFCKENSIPILTLEEAYQKATENQILGLSIRYPKLFKKEYFKVFTPGIVNFHGGPLPRARGQNIANQLILDDEPFGGGTLHFIDEGVDTGDIVYRDFFEIKNYYTGEEVFRLIAESLKVCMNYLLIDIEMERDLPRIPQCLFIEKGEHSVTYSANEVINKKSISAPLPSSEQLERIARAFYFKNHEPAYIKTCSSKIYLIPEFSLKS